jgi:hypothetical protein
VIDFGALAKAGAGDMRVGNRPHYRFAVVRGSGPAWVKRDTATCDAAGLSWVSDSPFKQLTGDPAQGPAIVAQTQTELGRGGTLQAFLAATCGVGSQA